MLEFLLDEEFDFIISYDNKVNDSYYSMCHPQRFRNSDDHIFIKLSGRKIYYRWNYGEYKLISFKELTEKINDRKCIFKGEVLEKLRKEIKSRDIHKNPVEPATEKQLKLIEKIETLINKFKGDTKQDAQKWISENITSCNWYNKEFNNFADKLQNNEYDPYYDDYDDVDTCEEYF